MKRDRLSWLEWLSYGPFLVQVVVTRRCNLSCGYCTEYDLTSDPIPFEVLKERFQKLRDLRAWALSFMGGEPTLHPDLLRLVALARTLGFRRRMLTTNGLLLTDALIDGLNEAGLTDMTVSVDGVKRNETTIKVLDTLKKRLERLAKRARFPVVLNAVVGSAPREEVLEVAEFARSRGFVPRILLIHDEGGQLRLSPEQRELFREVKRRQGREAAEAHDYRERLL
jgi:MoaA/NifB/PqqE/SkfB family radical SAM enzyme